MAEALGITTAVLTIVTRCITTARDISDVVERYKDVPQAILSLIQEAEAIKGALDSIKEALESNPRALIAAGLEKRFSGTIDGCQEILSRLDNELAELTNGPEWSQRLEKLWNEPKIARILDEMRGRQKPLALIMQALNTHIINALSRQVHEAIIKPLRPRYTSTQHPNWEMASADGSTIGVFSGNDSVISNTDFQFDQEIAMTQTYRNARAVAINEGTSTQPKKKAPAVGIPDIDNERQESGEHLNPDSQISRLENDAMPETTTALVEHRLHTLATIKEIKTPGKIDLATETPDSSRNSPIQPSSSQGASVSELDDNVASKREVTEIKAKIRRRSRGKPNVSLADLLVTEDITGLINYMKPGSKRRDGDDELFNELEDSLTAFMKAYENVQAEVAKLKTTEGLGTDSLGLVLLGSRRRKTPKKSGSKTRSRTSKSSSQKLQERLESGIISLNPLDPPNTRGKSKEQTDLGPFMAETVTTGGTSENIPWPTMNMGSNKSDRDLLGHNDSGIAGSSMPRKVIANRETLPEFEQRLRDILKGTLIADDKPQKEEKNTNPDPLQYSEASNEKERPRLEDNLDVPNKFRSALSDMTNSQALRLNLAESPSASTEFAQGEDTATGITQNMNRSRYSTPTPQEGEPTRITTKRIGKSQSQLLIEYFEGGKSKGPRPSVRVRVTPTGSRQTKEAGDHILISKSSHGKSYARRISLPKTDDQDTLSTTGLTPASQAALSQQDGVRRTVYDKRSNRNAFDVASDVSYMAARLSVPKENIRKVSSFRSNIFIGTGD